MGQFEPLLNQGHLFEAHGSLYLQNGPSFHLFLVNNPHAPLSSDLLEGSQRMPRHKWSDPGFYRSVKCAWQVHTVSPFVAEQEVPFYCLDLFFKSEMARCPLKAVDSATDKQDLEGVFNPSLIPLVLPSFSFQALSPTPRQSPAGFLICLQCFYYVHCQIVHDLQQGSITPGPQTTTGLWLIRNRAA